MKVDMLPTSEGWTDPDVGSNLSIIMYSLEYTVCLHPPVSLVWGTQLLASGRGSPEHLVVLLLNTNTNTKIRSDI